MGKLLLLQKRYTDKTRLLTYRVYYLELLIAHCNNLCLDLGAVSV